MRKMFFKAILALLSMLPFFGCGPAMEYGQPHVTLNIQGKVQSSQTGKAIPGIKIDLYQVDSEGTARLDYHLDEEISTDSNGNFIIQNGYFTDPPEQILFTDIDGEENGGEFKSKTVDLDLTQTDDGEGWYQGSYEQTDLNVDLDLKDDDNGTRSQ